MSLKLVIMLEMTSTMVKVKARLTRLRHEVEAVTFLLCKAIFRLERKGEDVRNRVHCCIKGQVPLTQASVEERLDEVGVPIGSKTTRNGLLELLGKHIQRKRLRTDENRQRIKSATQKARARQSEISTLVPPNAPSSIPTVPLVTPASPPADEVQTPTTDFCKFNDSQLVDLLRTVGVDTGPLDRAQLITQCQAYHELIIIPADFYTNTNHSTTFQTSSAFTLEIPFGDSPPVQSTNNSQTNLPSTTPQQPSLTTVENLQSLEYSRLSDSIIEEGSPRQTSLALPRVTRSLPKEKVTKKKKKKNDQRILTAPDLSQTVSSSISTSDDTSIQIGGDGTRSEDLSHLSTRRTSRSSTVKTALGSTSSPALRAPSSNSSPKGSKSKPSSQASTSKGSRVSAIVRLEASAPLSLHPTTSQKGKGVDRGEVTCLTLDTQPKGLQDHTSSMSHSYGPSLSESTSQTPVPNFPSLEHGRLAYPRPKPTMLNSSSNSAKHKSNKHRSYDSGNANLKSACGHHDTPSSTKRPSRSTHMPEKPSSHAQTAPTTHSDVDETTGAQEWSIPELKRKVAEDAILIRQLRHQTNELSERSAVKDS
ncbi:uncharacterized protein MELLADRAFT_113389 [Melampsora larici-populina 98AG31]|uniref:Uncharacterized protein n=1 Tax=Melampsora larici-populina (strain 98AG31 / pathotype 3-4-7) TaxID=747676 RepID=F4S9P7_MELLP|nr:uncharacterized protein MELLADRAFT_113389 [Melampsora larici-populina 98AG31]EGF98613.1 hypothetical protein MELLADRAFT_113389 [Melampsora larici-populina 98AG31]